MKINLQNFFKYYLWWLAFFWVCAYVGQVIGFMVQPGIGVVLGLGFSYWFMNLIQQALVPNHWFVGQSVVRLYGLLLAYVVAVFAVTLLIYQVDLLGTEPYFSFETASWIQIVGFHLILGYGAFASKLHLARALDEVRRLTRFMN